MPSEHRIKTWPAYWDAVERGEKTFEVRRDDRGYQKGDILVLQRTEENSAHSPVQTDYDGTVVYEIRKRVAYILTGGQFGIQPGYVVMALTDIEKDTRHGA